MAAVGDTFFLPPQTADKAALRSLARQRRAAVPRALRAAASRRMAYRLVQALPRTAPVAVYLSIGTEPSTAPLIEALRRHGHPVYAPLTLPGWRLRFVPLRADTPLRRRGRFRLLEPAVRRPQRSARQMGVIVLPLLAFDATGTRLGNGGGYYDRALAGLHGGRRPQRIGHAFAAQELSGLPRAPWDVPLDAVLTERGLRRFR